MSVLALLLLAAPAMAWEHEGAAWASLPVPLCIDNQGVDQTWVDDAMAAVDAWNDAAQPFGIQVFTTVASCGEAVVVVELTEASTLSRSIATDGAPVEVDGCSYLGMTTATISAGVGLATPHDEVDAEPCAGAVSLRRIVAHELGHVLGLAHSCEEGAACTDPDSRAALMYWSMAPCEVAYLPEADDVLGLQALYDAPACNPSVGLGSDADTQADTGSEFDVTPMPEDQTPKAGCGCTTVEPASRMPASLLLVTLVLAAGFRSRSPNRPAAAPPRHCI